MVTIGSKKNNKLLFGMASLCLLVACIEEIQFEQILASAVVPEDVLVVEATITDQFINHQVSLSRAKKFANDSTAIYEIDAKVRVIDEAGATFEFEDAGNGIYRSKSPFAAKNGMSYQLFITTSEGKEFESAMVSIFGESTIDDMYAERIINDNGEEGMAIFVDSSNPVEGSNNYRYTYEETYKIIAPNWSSREFEIIREASEEGPQGILYPDVKLVPRKEEERVCYNTDLSTDIILSAGDRLSQNNIDRNIVRFISRENPILSHRYSILVRQFLQSPDASNFYRTLLQFSQNESVFTDIQPGLLEGNIEAVNDTETIVLGYFNVASVTERRLFFDYSDFFLNEDLPPYFGTVTCDRFIAPILGNPERDGPVPPFANCGEGLIDLIKQERIEFFLSSTIPPGECDGPYLVTQRACGDCTVLGSNLMPDFWLED